MGDNKESLSTYRVFIQIEEEDKDGKFDVLREECLFVSEDEKEAMEKYKGIIDRES